MTNMTDQPQTEDDTRANSESEVPQLNRISASSFEEAMQYVDDSNIRTVLSEYLSNHAPINNDERNEMTEILRRIISKDYMTTLTIIAECEPKIAAIVELPQTESVPPITTIGKTAADITELATKLTAQLNSGNYEGLEDVLNECQAYLAVLKLKTFKDMVNGSADIAACNAIDKLTAALTKHRGLTKLLREQHIVSESLTELQPGERKLGVLLE